MARKITNENIKNSVEIIMDIIEAYKVFKNKPEELRKYFKLMVEEIIKTKLMAYSTFTRLKLWLNPDGSGEKYSNDIGKLYKRIVSLINQDVSKESIINILQAELEAKETIKKIKPAIKKRGRKPNISNELIYQIWNAYFNYIKGHNGKQPEILTLTKILKNDNIDVEYYQVRTILNQEGVYSNSKEIYRQMKDKLLTELKNSSSKIATKKEQKELKMSKLKFKISFEIEANSIQEVLNYFETLPENRHNIISIEKL